MGLFWEAGGVLWVILGSYQILVIIVFDKITICVLTVIKCIEKSVFPLPLRCGICEAVWGSRIGDRETWGGRHSLLFNSTDLVEGWTDRYTRGVTPPSIPPVIFS